MHKQQILKQEKPPLCFSPRGSNYHTIAHKLEQMAEEIILEHSKNGSSMDIVEFTDWLFQNSAIIDYLSEQICGAQWLSRTYTLSKLPDNPQSSSGVVSHSTQNTLLHEEKVCYACLFVLGVIFCNF
jgi:hypothetical protein